MQPFDYRWVPSKPRLKKGALAPKETFLEEAVSEGWEPIAVTTRPGILGGLLGTTETWVLMRKARAGTAA